MTTIEQLLQMPIGYKTGGFELTVKKFPSKMVTVDDNNIQPVTFIDKTGEMPGEIFKAKYGEIQKGYKVYITVGIIQNGEYGKKLFVDQYKIPTMTADEWEEMRLKDNALYNAIQDDEAIPSMCRNSQVREYIGGFVSHHGRLPEITDNDKKILNDWVEYILTGK